MKANLNTLFNWIKDQDVDALVKAFYAAKGAEGDVEGFSRFCDQRRREELHPALGLEMPATRPSKHVADANAETVEENADACEA